MMPAFAPADFWRDNGAGLLRHDARSWAMQFDRVENSFLQCEDGHLSALSTPLPDMYFEGSFTSDLHSTCHACEGVSQLLFGLIKVRLRCVQEQHVDTRRQDLQQPFPPLPLSGVSVCVGREEGEGEEEVMLKINSQRLRCNSGAAAHGASKSPRNRRTKREGGACPFSNDKRPNTIALMASPAPVRLSTGYASSRIHFSELAAWT